MTLTSPRSGRAAGHSSDLDVTTWRAVPLADPQARAHTWAIVAGPYADDGDPELFIEIATADNPRQVAEFLLEAARTHNSDRHTADLRAEADAARAELTRADGKAAALIGWAGTAFAILAAALSVASLPPLATGAVTLGAALLAAAVAVLMVVIRPAIPPRGQGTGFVRHAEATNADELLASLASTVPATRVADDVILLSALARTKYTRLRTAVDLLLAALLVLAVALLLGALA
jgi:hypothetical protein